MELVGEYVRVCENVCFREEEEEEEEREREREKIRLHKCPVNQQTHKGSKDSNLSYH